MSHIDVLLGIADEVLPVGRSTAVRAKEIVMGQHLQVSAGDAVHLAIMEQHRIERILSFDSGFDGFPGIARLSDARAGAALPIRVSWAGSMNGIE